MRHKRRAEKRAKRLSTRELVLQRQQMGDMRNTIASWAKHEKKGQDGTAEDQDPAGCVFIAVDSASNAVAEVAWVALLILTFNGCQLERVAVVGVFVACFAATAAHRCGAATCWRIEASAYRRSSASHTVT